jgi:predicted AAA+ superfamily ATPase
MKQRLLILEKDYSLFLFGARGVGKSTLVEASFDIKQCLFINLLDPKQEDRFAKNPNELIELAEATSHDITHIVIDEIQKLPKLLDVVHLLLETRRSQKYFILTGSSARKLKSAGVNLLAGRAFVSHLYPFTYIELDSEFNLKQALNYGMLPKVTTFTSEHSKRRFLEAYTLTYLKEEVWAEQLVKNLDPFRKFLEVAAQCNGKIINYVKIARDVGANDKTVKNYFSLLEDTLLGKILEPFHCSFRKRLKSAPKFYFFDVGIVRALTHMLNIPLREGTSYFGELFESFIIMECIKLASYCYSDYRFSYLMTADGVEIDLIVERPAQSLLLIEIKSSTQVQAMDLKNINNLSKELDNCEAVCFSNDPQRRKVGNIIIYPWQEGVKNFFYNHS